MDEGECFCLSKVINLGDLFSEPFISRDMSHPLKTSEAQTVPEETVPCGSFVALVTVPNPTQFSPTLTWTVKAFGVVTF